MKRRCAALLCGALLALPSVASAKVHLIVSYPFDAVWPGVLRFVEVDRGWKVSERDKDAGFVRFALIDDKKAHLATLELIRVTDGDGRAAVRLQLSSSDLARFQEAPVLDALARKLRDELGPPTPPPRKKDKDKEKDRDGGTERPPHAPDAAAAE